MTGLCVGSSWRLRAYIEVLAVVSSVLLWVGCGSDGASPGAARGASVAQLVLQDADGQPLPLSKYRAQDGAQPALLMLRVGASWCGPCLWQVEHTADLRAAAVKAGGTTLQVLDVLVAGRDNGAPTAQDFADYRQRLSGDAQIAADADFRLAAWFSDALVTGAGLPLIALLDTRDLTPVATLSAPSVDRLESALAEHSARFSGRAVPERSQPQLYDGLFTRDAWQLIQGMQLSAAAPPDASNAYADDPKAAAFGQQLFFAEDLTPSPRAVSCSGCHAPELLFQDGRDQPSAGVGSGVRNVPSIVLTPEQRWQFWDGRADVSWGQAVVPFEDATEFASSRLFVVHAVAEHYASDYQNVFGALPDVSDTQRFPAQAKPGDAAWEAMRPEDQRSVNRIFANLGKALSAYERSLRPKPNALDRYAAGETTALSDDEKAGLAAFVSAGCVQCHYGPRLTDDSFHVLGFPTGRPDRSADLGRSSVIDSLAALTFSRYGEYSDDPSVQRPTVEARSSLLGAFKTPGLRGVALTIPYGHGGSFGGLVSVIEAHRTPSVPVGSKLSVGEREPWLAAFDPQLIPRIVTFLKALQLELPAASQP